MPRLFFLVAPALSSALLLHGAPALADGPQRLKALGIVEGDGLAQLDAAAPDAALRRALEGAGAGLERN